MGDKDEKNRVLPYWKWVNENLESFGKNAFEPLEEFGEYISEEDDERQLWACACCWIWIPLCLGYAGVVISIFCALATFFVFIGFCLHVVCLAIGILPGFLLIPWLTLRSVLQVPRYMWDHLKIANANLEKGLVIKAACLLLLLPLHLLFPCLMAVFSSGIPVTAMVVAFFGCPITPWIKMKWVDDQFQEYCVDNVKEKVRKYEVSDNNYGDFVWDIVEGILNDAIPALISCAWTALGNRSDTKGTGIVKGVLSVFCLLWVPILVIYCFPFLIIYAVFVVTFFFVGLYQSLIHICFGFLPGVLIAVFVSGLSLARTPRNIFLHLKIVMKTYASGQIIKATNFLCLLPVQLLLPILVTTVSLVIAPLAAIALSVLGFPNRPWTEMKKVGKIAWEELNVKIEDQAKKYSPGNPETYVDTNLAEYYWSAVAQAMSLLEKAIVIPHNHIEKPKDHPIRTAFCAPLWGAVAFVYGLSVALTFVLCVTPLVLIGLGQSIVLFAMGVWPGVLIGLSFTVITTIRVPHNIYYHCLITYRTIMLRPNLKVMSFIFVPPTHFLVPLVIGVLSFGGAIPTAGAASFAGYPHKAWSKVEQLTKKFWKRYVTDIKAHVDNFGHETGIPENWDGKIYGLPVDPMTIVMAILFYAYGIPPVSIGLIAIIVLKSIPMLLRAVAEYWEKVNYFRAVKDWIQLVRQGLEYQACSKYAQIIGEYSNFIEMLDPKFVSQLVGEYTTECDFFPWLKRLDIDPCSGLILSPCLILTFFAWLFGLVGVVALTVGLLLAGVFIWMMGWSVTIIVPPAIYVAAWITVLFVIPTTYTFCWIVGFCFTLFYPWPCMLIAMLTGPLLALKVPFVFFKNNLLNPGELDQSIKTALRMPWEILKELDRQTGKLTLQSCQMTFCTHPREEEQEVKELETHASFNYWRHVEKKCKAEVGNVLEKNWFTTEDVEDQVKTLVAIPGFTVLAILVDSLKNEEKHNNDRSLIYWNEKDRCTQRRRIRGDNIANHFFPLLVRAKNKLRDLGDLEQSAELIKAKFCDADDRPTPELKRFLDAAGSSLSGPRIQCKSELENLAHALLRVKKVQEVLEKIASYDFTKMKRLVFFPSDKNYYFPLVRSSKDSDEGFVEISMPEPETDLGIQLAQPVNSISVVPPGRGVNPGPWVIPQSSPVQGDSPAPVVRPGQAVNPGPFVTPRSNLGPVAGASRVPNQVPRDVGKLLAMGFPRAGAEEALREANNDVSRATSILLRRQ